LLNEIEKAMEEEDAELAKQEKAEIPTTAPPTTTTSTIPPPR
jgi:hypothetical protein